MIAVDSNILVYSHRVDSGWHTEASRCLRDLAEGSGPWLIPWPCIHEFMGVVTNPRIFPKPSTVAEAIRQVEAWQASPTLRIRGEAMSHWETLRDLIGQAKVVGPAIHDARVAAICLDQQADLIWTADRDFARFPSLRAENPLVRR